MTSIRTTREKLWQALIDPEFTRKYWVEAWQESEWKPGASWRLMIRDGRVGDAGEILEIEPGRRLVLSWRNEFKPELRAAAIASSLRSSGPYGTGWRTMNGSGMNTEIESDFEKHLTKRDE